MALVVAARRGDPAAFARIVEHWNPHLRPFVHHVLAGDGSADRALSAAYVRAYRALPRYRAELKPGLWLHRIAFLAATDELRRVRRDPARRRAMADAGRSDERRSEADLDPAAGFDPERGLRVARDDPGRGGQQVASPPGSDIDEGWPILLPTDFDGLVDEPAGATESAIIEAHNLIALAGGTVPEATFPPGWRRLAPDQRALAVMVDLEGYRVDEAASALDADAEPAIDRLSSARRLLARRRTGSIDLDQTGAAGERALADAARAVLTEVDIAPIDPEFWSILGRRLLAEREAPAAPSIDPMARLAKAHPAEPGFKPSTHLRPLPGDGGQDSVQGLAHQAERTKQPRGWRRPALVVASVVVVAACLAVAVWVGTRNRIPDGTRAAGELAAPVSAAMAEGPYRRLETMVVEGSSSGASVQRAVVLVVANDGSWVVSQAGTIDQSTYDADEGLVRRAAVIGSGDDATLAVNDTGGLAAGPPDPSPTIPSPLLELQVVPSLLRAAGEHRVPRRTVDDRRVWELERTLPTGDQGSDELWRVQVDSTTSLPVSVERTRGGRLVRRVEVVSWSIATEVAADTFLQPVPADTEPTTNSYGFTSTELAAVPLLGRGEAVTPGWLPGGFELEVVAVRATAPTGAVSTAGGTNPPDEGVLSLGFQRGLERITVSTRSAGSDPGSWSSPLPATLTGQRERTLGDGRFNGARARAGSDLFGRAHLWLVSDDTVLTVSGDLTVDEAFQLATSLR